MLVQTTEIILISLVKYTNSDLFEQTTELQSNFKDSFSNNPYTYL